jgi:hypothetical protein
MTNKEYAESLRLIADFFEKHQELNVPWRASEFHYLNAFGKEEMARVARALGKCEKDVDETWFMLKKKFGHITFVAKDSRGAICERIAVGTKMVEETRTPAREVEIIPAHEETIYEWKCPESLLEEASDAR